MIIIQNRRWICHQVRGAYTGLEGGRKENDIIL